MLSWGGGEDAGVRVTSTGSSLRGDTESALVVSSSSSSEAPLIRCERRGFLALASGDVGEEGCDRDVNIGRSVLLRENIR